MFNKQTETQQRAKTTQLKQSTQAGIIAKRVSLLKSTCIEYRRNHPPESSESQIEQFLSLGNLAHHVMRYVNTKQKFVQLPEDVMLCIAPKTGITNWVHFVVSLLSNEKPKQNKIYHHPFFERVESFTAAERGHYGYERKVENLVSSEKMVRVINVRHPLARLYSAWKDKLWFQGVKSLKYEDPDHHTSFRVLKHFPRLIRKFETADSLKTKEKQHAVSFEAFLKYLVYGKGTENEKGTENAKFLRFYNKHWARFTDLCRPCSLNYSFVTHTETMVEDSQVILDAYEEFSSGWPIQGGWKKTEMDYSDYVGRLIVLYENIPGSLMRDLCEFYEWDFRLFGYDIEPFLS